MIADKALSVINKSHVICVFGASIGATDGYWWRKIGEWMKTTNGILVIFDICGQTNEKVDPLIILENVTNLNKRRKDIINRFTSLSGLGEGWESTNPNRIIVELDRPMFNFKLPLHKNNEKLTNPLSQAMAVGKTIPKIPKEITEHIQASKEVMGKLNYKVTLNPPTKIP